MTTKIVKKGEGQRAERMESADDPAGPALRRWFWLTTKDHRGKVTKELVCCVKLGSNYGEVRTVGGQFGSNYRISFTEWHDELQLEPNPEQVISQRIKEYQEQAQHLMAQVNEQIRLLAINLDTGAEDTGSEIMLHNSVADPAEYKAALIKAERTSLPELFERIKGANERMSYWMCAMAVPLKALEGQLRPVLDAVRDRVHSIELYAGLQEQIEQIREGKPAPVTEQIHLFQRRAYMDEECLVKYKAGGMKFGQIQDFDEWLLHPDNLERLLPFPKCMLAMRVRRTRATYEFADWRASVEFAFGSGDAKEKFTYIYIRNGEAIYRMSTTIDFGDPLFPDQDATQIGQDQLYYNSGERKIYTEAEYTATAKSSFYGSDFHPVTKADVYYDDAVAVLKRGIDEHNRLATVLQGLLDRSLVLHPHPPWKIWDPAEFKQAFRLIYDDSRALTPGEMPDFEAYRDRLNANLKVGDVITGADDFWARKNAQEYNEKNHERGANMTWLRPYDSWDSSDHGPGVLARVTAIRGGYVTVAWQRARTRWARDAYCDVPVPGQTLYVDATLRIPIDLVLNASAYKRGDFAPFYADPRSRALYFKWALHLLPAEDFAAGKGQVGTLPSPRTAHANRCAIDNLRNPEGLKVNLPSSY